MHGSLDALNWQNSTDIWVYDLIDELSFNIDLQIDGLVQDCSNSITAVLC